MRVDGKETLPFSAAQERLIDEVHHREHQGAERQQFEEHCYLELIVAVPHHGIGPEHLPVKDFRCTQVLPANQPVTYIGQDQPF